MGVYSILHGTRAVGLLPVGSQAGGSLTQRPTLGVSREGQTDVYGPGVPFDEGTGRPGQAEEGGHVTDDTRRPRLWRVPGPPPGGGSVSVSEILR